MEKPLLFLDSETTGKNPHTASLIGMSWAIGDGEPKWGSVTQFWADIEDLNDYRLVLHNAKYDAVVLKAVGIDILPHLYFDTMVAYYLLHIDKSCKMENILFDQFRIKKDDLLTVYNKCTGKDMKKLPADWYTKVPYNTLGEYARDDIDATRKIFHLVHSELEANEKLRDWFYRVEMPLVSQFTRTELKGVTVNLSELKSLEGRFTKRREELLSRIRFLTGNPELNCDSPKQVSEYLYVQQKLKTKFKTDTGNDSTGSKALAALVDTHAVPKLLLEYKELAKILSGFVLPLQEKADEEGAIHTTYSQCLTDTRRISSKDPNLQNIPAKTEIGRMVRSTFIPRPGNKFFIGDYDQVEMRLLAHFSKDEKLVNAFLDGVDIHSLTAEFIGKMLGEEFPRSKGKLLNFSIVYGKTAYGFAQDWNCTEDEAQKILDCYFACYPGVRQYLDDQIKVVKKNKGWNYTLEGLPLWIGEDIFSSKTWVAESAERKAANYRIQGSSQDIIKLAKCKIMARTGLVPCLEVHDELVYEVYDDQYIVETEQDLKADMEGVASLLVPLKASTKIATYWEK